MITALVTCWLAGGVRAAGAEEGVEYQTQSAQYMATEVQATVPSGRSDAITAAFHAFEHVEQVANEWREGSPIATLNQRAGAGPQPVSSEVLALLQRGVALGALTDGSYDITWAALWGVWRFGDDPAVPTEEVLAQRIERVDYRAVKLDPEALTVTLPQGVVLGVGGMAKGYALDLAVAKLKRLGVESYSLRAGGQVYVGGQRGDRAWRVGIRDPRGPVDDYFAVLEVTDVSVSTSGDYERFFVREGVRYHHIIDPRSGSPARGLRSVTILSADATLADALSTAVMVLGKQRGMDLVASVDGVEAVVVDDQGGVAITAGVRDQVTLVHSPAQGALP